MIRFTANPEINYSTMDDADILAGTDVSVSADRKFTLAGLAKWLIEIYAGSTIAGAAQSVKSVLDRLTTVASAAVTVTTGGFSSTEYFNKHGNVIEFTYANGSDSAFSSFVAGEQICTIPAGYRPTHTLFFHGTARTAGSWTNSTIIPIALRIAADGAVTCFANQPNMRTCKYICVSMVYSIA